MSFYKIFYVEDRESQRSQKLRENGNYRERGRRLERERSPETSRGENGGPPMKDTHVIEEIEE